MKEPRGWDKNREKGGVEVAGGERRMRKRALLSETRATPADVLEHPQKPSFGRGREGD